MIDYNQNKQQHVRSLSSSILAQNINHNKKMIDIIQIEGNKPFPQTNIKFKNISPESIEEKENIKDGDSNSSLLPPRSPILSPSSSCLHLNSNPFHNKEKSVIDATCSRFHERRSSSSSASTFLSFSPSVICNEEENIICYKN